MTQPVSLMRQEILEIPAAVDRLLTEGEPAVARAAAALAKVDPAFLVTVARGSSDHVCSYLKYAAELELGVPVASVGPSVASIYKRPLKLARGACIAVSQSGQSPDIVEMARAARRDGALSLAITNDPASPLAAASDQTLALHAGPERSVAATKTFVTSAVVGLWLLARWRDDAALLKAIHALPETLGRAVALDWPDLRSTIGTRPSLYTLGRGPSWAMSNEAALKFKETCLLHAESYSSAEVLHGPVSIVDQGFPVLCLAAGDAAEPVLADIARQVASKGAATFITSGRDAGGAVALPHVRTEHPLTDPLTLIATFYAMVERLAVERGIDPDTPRHLKKVTQTL
jgi:glucosamine--fructose-6-phosphate aminotransferase (isomerizing)